jgi:hypothetical protein
MKTTITHAISDTSFLSLFLQGFMSISHPFSYVFEGPGRAEKAEKQFCLPTLPY